MSYLEEIKNKFTDNNSIISAYIETEIKSNILSYKNILISLKELEENYEIIHLSVFKRIPFIKLKK